LFGEHKFVANDSAALRMDVNDIHLKSSDNEAIQIFAVLRLLDCFVASLRLLAMTTSFSRRASQRVR